MFTRNDCACLKWWSQWMSHEKVMEVIYLLITSAITSWPSHCCVPLPWWEQAYSQRECRPIPLSALLFRVTAWYCVSVSERANSRLGFWLGTFNFHWTVSCVLFSARKVLDWQYVDVSHEFRILMRYPTDKKYFFLFAYM